ncbi:MAG: chromosome segregation protein SMC [Acidobacteria bacterium]|nr:MAG: chromosome segregation protein SMC [Acidobacteriota bacterium]
MPHSPTSIAERRHAAAGRGEGALWRRVDLHLHSPGVETFKLPPGSDVRSEAGRRKVVDAYVERLVDAAVDVAAITDYNGIRVSWFRSIRDRAAERGITVLPGVEISFRVPKYGLHVLAIFDRDRDVDEVNRFLPHLDGRPEKPLIDERGKHRDIEPEGRVEDCLSKLRERFPCVLILPHPDQESGFAKSYKPKDAVRFLRDVAPDAIEHCSEKTIEALRSTGDLPESLLDRLVFVEFSDPKRIDEIGGKSLADGRPRATYLKLSHRGLEAIHLALHDPQTRLAVGRQPPVATHPRIRRMAVDGSGFLGRLEMRWNDDLNVIIGGRGTGKSAIVEVLRYALDLPPYADASSREDLVRHALGSGGRVELELERSIGAGRSQCYRIRRVWGEEPRVVDAASGKTVATPPAEALGPNGGPVVFGQREIYEASRSERERLALLDQLIGEEAKSCERKVEQALSRLRANARQLLEARKNLDRRDELRDRLQRIEHEIAVYEKHGAATKLEQAKRLREDRQRLRTATDAIQEARDAWQDAGSEVESSLARARDALSRRSSSQREILAEAERRIDDLERTIDHLIDRGEAAFGEGAAALKALVPRWQKAVEPLEEEINRIKQEAQTEALDPDRLLALSEEKAGLEPQLEHLRRYEADLHKLRQERRSLVEQARDLRLEVQRLRRERAEQIAGQLEGRLRLEVELKGQKEGYRVQLAALLKGSGLTADAIDRLAAPEATDGIALAAAVREGAAAVAEQFDVTETMARRLVDWLGDERRLFELETFLPADALRIKLRIGDDYRELDELSAGQRATAILLLLFALEGRVLVLDQPEDDLDNRFVYEDVVQILRQQKGLDDRPRRQIIAASHNANIPVLGDAELVLALEVENGRAQISDRGSIDDPNVRERIKTIMEGGEEALARRFEKYRGLRGRP